MLEEKTKPITRPGQPSWTLVCNSIKEIVEKDENLSLEIKNIVSQVKKFRIKKACAEHREKNSSLALQKMQKNITDHVLEFFQKIDKQGIPTKKLVKTTSPAELYKNIIEPLSTDSTKDSLK